MLTQGIVTRVCCTTRTIVDTPRKITTDDAEVETYHELIFMADDIDREVPFVSTER